MRFAIRAAPEQYDGRSCGDIQGEQGTKIGVRRDQNSVLFSGGIKDRVVGRRLQSFLSDVHSIMTFNSQTFSHAR